MPCTWPRKYLPGDAWTVNSVQAPLRHTGWTL